MIKASELRIGNRVLYKPYGNREGDVVTIAGLLGMKAYFNKHTNESGMFHNLQPIPLTPEILEKCGFEIHKGYNSIFICGDVAIIQQGTDYFLIAQEVIDEYLIEIGKPFQFVHQLQNLFFALAGEELTIKL